MKTENTENEALNKTDVKCRFFAQYFGLQVYHLGNVTIPFVFNENSFPILKNGYLKLKPLSKITKKDLEKIGFGNISNKKVTFDFLNYNYWWSSSCGMHGILLLKDIDYLRSKGYALPFMEYSVEDLISLGWVRLV